VAEGHRADHRTPEMVRTRSRPLEGISEAVSRRVERERWFSFDFEQEAESGPVTLLFGAKDERHNEAVVLRSILNNH